MASEVGRHPAPVPPPLVSVIVPVKDDADGLDLCLTALAAQTYASDRLEILVVDNGSQQPPAEVVSRHPVATLLQEPRPGSYAARNLGLANARGAIIGFTDADCIPAPGWVAAAVAHFEQAPDCGLLAGRIEVTVPPDPTTAHLYERVAGFPQERYATRQRFAATANAWIQRGVLAAVAGFNDDLQSSGDVDFGHRVSAAGYDVCFANDVVVHHPARDRSALLQKQRRIAAGMRHRHAIEGGGSWNARAVSLASMAFPFWGAFRVASQLPGHGLAARARLFGFTVFLRYYRLWFYAVRGGRR